MSKILTSMIPDIVSTLQQIIKNPHVLSEIEAIEQKEECRGAAILNELKHAHKAMGEAYALLNNTVLNESHLGDKSWLGHGLKPKRDLIKGD